MGCGQGLIGLQYLVHTLDPIFLYFCRATPAGPATCYLAGAAAPFHHAAALHRALPASVYPEAALKPYTYQCRHSS